MFISGGEDGQVCNQPLHKIREFLNSGFFSSDSDLCVASSHTHTPFIPLIWTEVKKSQCEYEAPAVCCVLGNRLGTSCRLNALHQQTGREQNQPRHCLLELRTCLTAWWLPHLLNLWLHRSTLSNHWGTQFCPMSNRGVLHLWYEEFWSSTPYNHLCYRIFYSEDWYLFISSTQSMSYYYRLKVCVLQIQMLKPNFQCGVVKGWQLWEVMRSWVGLVSL